MKVGPGEPFEILRAKIKELPEDIRHAFVVALSVGSQAPLKEAYGVVPKEIMGVPVGFDERVADHEILLLQIGDYETETAIHPGEALDVHLQPWWKNWLIGDQLL